MVDKSTIEDWATEHAAPIAQEALEKAVRVHITSESLREAALKHPGTVENPLQGLQNFLQDQINNKFMTDIVPTKIDWMKSGPIKVVLSEKKHGTYPIELELEFPIHRNAFYDARQLALNAYRYRHDDELSEVAMVDGWAAGFNIHGTDMDGLVRGYNALMRTLHEKSGTMLPRDMIKLDAGDFKQKGASIA